MELTESIVINITWESDGETKNGNLKNLTRQIEVIDNGLLVFTERQNIRHPQFKTRGGIAGAVNLLGDLIAGHADARYVNDEYKLWEELQSRHNRACYGAKVGKHASFFAKMRFKLFYLKMKLFNVLFE
jgi:hypothetical protein